jgi:DNA-directed RNA polymerase specialized sigma24 family protein
MMLIELCKRDKEWRKMAFHICKSKDLADDIVQDMYLKFANYNKTLNDYYIFFALKSIFLDYLRKEKPKAELSDNLTTFDEYDYDLDNLKEIALVKVNQLPYFEKELLTVTQEISQRQLARETDIAFIVINKTIKNTKVKLWADLEKIKDLEM